MSETKKPAAAPKGVKRRGRTKTDKEAERMEEGTAEAMETLAERTPAGEATSASAADVPVTEAAAPLTVADAPASQAATTEPAPARTAAPPSAPAPGATATAHPGSKFRLSDEYTLQTFFDKAAKAHVAQVAEFPEMRVSATTREAAVLEMENKLENHVENLRRRGEQLPEAFSGRRYPEKLDVKISQGLFRRLDNLSRHEKVSVDQLVIELLSSAITSRLEALPRDRQLARQPQPQQGQPPRHNQPEPGNRKQGPPPHRGQHHGGHRRASQEVMESRESFMEYVRNLEKSGGGRWKK